MCWFLLNSLLLDQLPDKSQAIPHCTDDDAEAKRGDLTCPSSLGQLVQDLRLDLKSVPSQSPLCVASFDLGDPPLPLFLQLWLCGTAIVPGFWNFLSSLYVESS